MQRVGLALGLVVAVAALGGLDGSVKAEGRQELVDRIDRIAQELVSRRDSGPGWWCSFVYHIAISPEGVLEHTEFQQCNTGRTSTTRRWCRLQDLDPDLIRVSEASGRPYLILRCRAETKCLRASNSSEAFETDALPFAPPAAKLRELVKALRALSQQYHSGSPR